MPANRAVSLADFRENFSQHVRMVGTGGALEIQHLRRPQAILSKAFDGVAPTREITEVQASREVRALVEGVIGTKEIVRIHVPGAASVDLKAV